MTRRVSLLKRKRERERWKVGVGWSVAKEDRGCTENWL